MKTTLLKRVLFMAVMVLFGTQLNAQETFQIKGKIVNSDRVAICSANIALLDAKTMEVVAETTCNDKGEFVIENMEKGDYILSVSKPGYKKSTMRYIALNDVGKISDTYYAKK